MSEQQQQLGIDVPALVELYREAAKVRDEAFALKIAAEAMASESTAVQSQAAEAVATTAASAISDLARLRGG